jgi:hypothetical protein
LTWQDSTMTNSHIRIDHQAGPDESNIGPHRYDWHVRYHEVSLRESACVCICANGSWFRKIPVPKPQYYV